ncbi:MAG: 50S ribosomal protein L17 [Candidatus Omnitrophica bacterium]|jgi:large subunit ribosomal protein L17|nr:50S ribosomal protein L17 [Candidatus Omnitrophota bacterium]
MRHKKAKNRLNRFTSWRKATLKSMARNLFIYQTMTTTLAKAKAARPVVEKLITLAKEDTLSARRKAYAVLCDHALVKVLFDDIGKRFADRTGGYIRILHLGKRRGDNAQMAIFELTEIKKKEVKKVKKEKEQKAVEADKKHEQGQVIDTVAVQPPVKPKHEEKPVLEKKPQKKFLGGIKNIFKKERDSL